MQGPVLSYQTLDGIYKCPACYSNTALPCNMCCGYRTMPFLKIVMLYWNYNAHINSYPPFTGILERVQLVMSKTYTIEQVTAYMSGD